MIATTTSYKLLTEEIKEQDKSLFEQGWKLPAIKEETKITVLDRSGTFGNVWYRRRTRDAKDVAMGQQDIIVKTIIEDYMKRMHTVAYIHGNPGTGKSMIGILIANEFCSYFCNTLKPWQPGDSMSGLITEAEPTPQKPLIVVFDEADQVLVRIHEGIPPHKNMPTAVSDKSGWNHLLDSIQRGMYPNVILLLTGNNGPAFINELDPSYIRKGRVDNIFHMTQSLID
jgi:SpoVK/Ycf46/Vps4 family AAA+-type ATPase